MYFPGGINRFGIPRRNPQIIFGGRGRGRGAELANPSCFYCQNQGHWARFCPMIRLPFALPPPQLRCRCGAGICLVTTSVTATNAGRKFYICPARPERCGFSKWCDQVSMDEINNPPLYNFPDCVCGAGKCKISKMSDGRNAGRSCFVCPLPRGNGACGFAQLLNTRGAEIGENGQPESISLSFTSFTPENGSDSDSVEDGEVSSCLRKEGDMGSDSDSVEDGEVSSRLREEGDIDP